MTGHQTHSFAAPIAMFQTDAFLSATYSNKRFRRLSIWRVKLRTPRVEAEPCTVRSRPERGRRGTYWRVERDDQNTSAYDRSFLAGPANATAPSQRDTNMRGLR